MASALSFHRTPDLHSPAQPACRQAKMSNSPSHVQPRRVCNRLVFMQSPAVLGCWNQSEFQDLLGQLNTRVSPTPQAGRVACSSLRSGHIVLFPNHSCVER